MVAFVLFVSGEDFSGLDGDFYIFWLVRLMAVVLILEVIGIFLGVSQIWLRSIHMSCRMPITKLMELQCW